MFHRNQYFVLLLLCVMSCSFLQAMDLLVDAHELLCDENSLPDSDTHISGKRKRNNDHGSDLSAEVLVALDHVTFGGRVARRRPVSRHRPVARRAVSSCVVPCRDALAEISNEVACAAGISAAAQDCVQGDFCVVVPDGERCAEVLPAKNALKLGAACAACEPAAKRICYGGQSKDTLTGEEQGSSTLCAEGQQDSFFAQWYQQCNEVFSKQKLMQLANCGVNLDELPDAHVRGVRWSVLAREIDIFGKTMARIFKNALWLHEKSNVLSEDKYIPYVQKLVVAPNSTVLFHGDVHGDIHSINNFLFDSIQNGYLDANLKIVVPDCYFVFLGDYVDRGIYGAEVLYIILKLKNENPNNVFLVRGNHESITQNADPASKGGGFVDELESKFSGITQEQIYFVFNVYNKLPLALYIGCEASDGIIDYIQCCHGGVEMRVDPKLLLQKKGNSIHARLDQLYRNVWQGMQQNFVQEEKWEMLTKHSDCSIEDDILSNGFMWSDFLVNDGLQAFVTTRGADDCFKFGRRVTHQYLEDISDVETYQVHGIFRGHQHGDPDMMNLILQRPQSEFDQSDKGVGKLWLSTDLAQRKLDKRLGRLWNGIVCTFMVSPDCGFGEIYKYSQDYYGILTMDCGFDNWCLKIADANAKK